MKTKLLCLLTTILILGCVSKKEITLPTSGEQYGDWAHSYITDEVNNLKIPGGVNALVISKGETLYRDGFNYGDETTPMPVGSISKIFTGLGIMRLIEENRLTLNTTLDTLIPEIKFDNGEERIITIKMLLTHTSGIQGVIYRDFYTLDYTDGNDYFRTVLEYMDTNPLICEPGKMFAYSNVAYDLLGVIIERVSGSTFSEYIRTEVFDRAGLQDSLVFPGERDSNLPLGYGFAKEPINPPLIRDIPAGGMLFSLRDMESFIYALLDGKIVSEETLELMTTKQNSNIAVDQNFDIGLAFWLENPFGTKDKMFGHSGDITPFHANLMIFPERKSAVFLATNDQTKSTSIALEYSYKLAEGLLQYETGVEFSTLQNNQKRAVGKNITADIVEGHYASALGSVELKADGENLQCTVGKMKLYSERKESGFWDMKIRLFGLFNINIPQLELLEYDTYQVDGENYIAIWMAGIYMGASKEVKPISDMESFSINQGTYVAVDGKQDEYGIMPDRVVIKRDKKGVYYLQYKIFGSKMSVMLDPRTMDFADTSGESRDMGQGLYFSGESSTRNLTWTGIEFQRI